MEGDRDPGGDGEDGPTGAAGSPRHGRPDAAPPAAQQGATGAGERTVYQSPDGRRKTIRRQDDRGEFDSRERKVIRPDGLKC